MNKTMKIRDLEVIEVEGDFSDELLDPSEERKHDVIVIDTSKDCNSEFKKVRMEDVKDIKF